VKLAGKVARELAAHGVLLQGISWMGKQGDLALQA
jgi:hypothetical protein